MPGPTIPASHLPLLDARTAVLATIDREGRPQQTAVWFLAEDGVVRISLNDDRRKVRNLRDNPSVGFFVLDPGNAQRYLEIRGDADIADDPDRDFAAKVGAKYDADLNAYDAPESNRVVVTIVPSRVNAVDMSG